MNTKLVLPIIVVFAWLLSCTKNVQEQTISHDLNSERHQLISKSITKGIRKLNNPYSVANMRKAYQSLALTNRSLNASDAANIKATHYYVKFMPEDEKDLSTLKKDSTIEYYQHPLDVEFPEGYNPSDYLDPEVKVLLMIMSPVMI